MFGLHGKWRFFGIVETVGCPARRILRCLPYWGETFFGRDLVLFPANLLSKDGVSTDRQRPRRWCQRDRCDAWQGDPIVHQSSQLQLAPQARKCGHNLGPRPVSIAAEDKRLQERAACKCDECHEGGRGIRFPTSQQMPSQTHQLCSLPSNRVAACIHEVKSV